MYGLKCVIQRVLIYLLSLYFQKKHEKTHEELLHQKHQQPLAVYFPKDIFELILKNHSIYLQLYESLLSEFYLSFTFNRSFKKLNKVGFLFKYINF